MNAMSDPSQTWLISGVSTGLGHETAKAALAAGHKVIGTVRKEADAESFAALAPGRALPFRIDLTDLDAVAPAVQEIEKAHGPIDVLVSNAGYGLVGAVEETSLAEAQALFQVNFFGAFALIKAVLPGMRQRRAGTILIVTSVSGLAPWAGTALYGASKFALDCLGRTLADEMRPLGIRVVNVAPGGLRTDFSGRSLNEAEVVIDDYAGIADLPRRIFAENRGHEPGDPAKAAQAIVSLAAAETVPTVQLLGSDAVHYAQSALGALQLDYGEGLSLALTTDCKD